MDNGLYIAVFLLKKNCRIKVGRLGTFTFRTGWYLYVGSAKKNLSARLERHSLKNKPLRWHIDYLSVKSQMLGTIVIKNENVKECDIAKELGKLFILKVPGFGSSDCRCKGHLFYSEKF